LKSATRERDTWGAAWRQRDFDFFTSQEFRQLLAAQNIKLITWREIAATAKSEFERARTKHFFRTPFRVIFL